MSHEKNKQNGINKAKIFSNWLNKKKYQHVLYPHGSIRLELCEKLSLSMIFDPKSTSGWYCETMLIYMDQLTHVKKTDYEDVMRFNRRELEEHIISLENIFHTDLGDKLYISSMKEMERFYVEKTKLFNHK